MAAIFQIRRGITNASLAEGELYLHEGSGSLQIGSGSGAYNVLTLDAPVNGNINLGGNITASNAYFSGDVAISGNLFLGNNTSDNIAALGVFTTDLKPGTQNAYNVGLVGSEWNNVYANTISASNLIGNLNVSATSAFNGGVTAGSLNVTGVSYLNKGVTAGSLYVTGASNLIGDLTVSSSSTFNRGFTAGSAYVTGESIFNGAVTAGSIDVTGAALLQLGITAGSINVTGTSTFNNGFTAGSAFVTGDSILNGSQGPLLYPADECKKSVKERNAMLWERTAEKEDPK